MCNRWACCNVPLHRSGAMAFHHRVIGDIDVHLDTLELPAAHLRRRGSQSGGAGLPALPCCERSRTPAVAYRALRVLALLSLGACMAAGIVAGSGHGSGVAALGAQPCRELPMAVRRSFPLHGAAKMSQNHCSNIHSNSCSLRWHEPAGTGRAGTVQERPHLPMSLTTDRIHPAARRGGCQ